ncbi:MAG: hypothetical protein LBV72_06475 [Tannerella sp.]|nr:hypothetical protein [Tannerella sp.]
MTLSVVGFLIVPEGRLFSCSVIDGLRPGFPVPLSLILLEEGSLSGFAIGGRVAGGLLEGLVMLFEGL